MTSDEERKRRQMGSPVWPLKPGPFAWEKEPQSMTKSPSPSVDEVALEAAFARFIAARDAYIASHPMLDLDACIKAALAASLVSPPKAGAGEPVAWQVDGGGSITTSRQVADTWVAMFGCKVIPLYANHEARGDGVRVRALEWEAYGGRWRASAPSIAVLKYIINPDSGGRFYVSVNGQPLTGTYGSSTDAKAAGQAHFDAAIRSAALPPLGDGRAEIATIADYEEATNSHLAHVLDLDIAMNGVGAAKRPLLIDIKAQLLEKIAKADNYERAILRALMGNHTIESVSQHLSFMIGTLNAALSLEQGEKP